MLLTAMPSLWAAIPQNAFQGDYWNLPSTSGASPAFPTTAPTATRTDAAINFNWGSGAPMAGINAEDFAVRWQGTWNFATSGIYEFAVTTDDGFRLSIDGVQILNQWKDQVATYTIQRSLSAGSHLILAEQYENGGGAQAKLTWRLLPTITVPSAGVTATATQTSSTSNRWTTVGTDKYTYYGYEWLEYVFDFGAGGSWLFSLTATNEPYPSAPGLPSGYSYSIDLWVDGAYRSTFSVPGSTTAYQTGTSASALSLSGLHTVRFLWTNDTYTAGLYDANIRVKQIAVVPATGDTTPPLLSSLTTAEVFPTAVTLTWTTNEPATSQVEYGTTVSYGQITPLDATSVTSHRVAIWDLTPGTLYHARVRSKDVAGNEALSSDATFTTPASTPTTTGTILREYWSGITGVAVSNLTSHPNYPNSSSGTSSPTLFEAPLNWADNYGTRIRGYVHPPTSGSYVFWISSDDNSELWLSSSDNPASKVLIARVPSWTNSRQWTTYPEQQSAPIALTGGQKYYIEALQKEGTGGDNLAVGWQLVSGPLERPIPGSRLSPFTTTPPSGPIAHWQFDESSGTTATDSSGNNNTGTLVNGPTWIPGRIGNGLSFDGVNDSMSVADSTSLRLGTTMTVSTWVSVRANVADWVRLVGKGSSSDRNYGLWREWDGDLLFQIYSQGAASACNFWNNLGAGSSTNIAAGSGWHHVLATYDGTTGNMYVDGTQAYSGACTITPAASADPLTVGYAGFHTYLNGLLDDVRLYNRALSASEISSLYSSVPSDTTPPTGTVTINAGASYTKTIVVTLTLSATDNSGAVSQMQCSNDNVTYSAAEAYATSKSWTLASGDGTKTVYAKFKDAAGNWSAAVSDTIILDSTPPAVTFTSPSDQAVLGPQ